MSWAVYRDRPRAVSHGERVRALLALIFERPGISTSELVDRSGIPISNVRTTLNRLQARGLLRSERIVGRRNAATLSWYATALGREMHDVDGVRVSTLRARILAAATGRAWTIDALATHLGHARQTVLRTCHQLHRAERLGKITEDGVTRWIVGGTADRPARTTPTADAPAPWVHPIRARALGLPVASRRGAA